MGSGCDVWECGALWMGGAEAESRTDGEEGGEGGEGGRGDEGEVIVGEMGKGIKLDGLVAFWCT